MNFALVLIRGSLVFMLLTGCGTDDRSSSVSVMGDWDGIWTRNGDTIDVRMHFEQADSGHAGNFSSNALRIVEIPFQGIEIHGDTCIWSLVGDATTTFFTGRVNGDSLSGTFMENDEPGSFRFSRIAPPPPIHDTDITFTSGSAMLAGTVLMPAGKGPFPGVVFLHGSGAEGRWASRFLAQRFAEAGIAALIFDKRGVGNSTGDRHVADFDTLALDAASAIAAMRKIPDVDATRVGIHGHSQGGTLAPYVAELDSTLAFVVASAPAGIPLDSMERYSVLNNMGIAGMTAEERSAAEGYVDAIVAVAYHDAPYQQITSAWHAVADRPWAFEPPPSDDPYWAFSSRIAKYDPIAHWRRVRIPTLVVFGESDERVPARTSIDRIRAAHRPYDLRILSFPNADHNFRQPSPERSWPRSAPGYPERLIDEVKGMLAR
jgi:dienelactone hydrolase